MWQELAGLLDVPGSRGAVGVAVEAEAVLSRVFLVSSCEEQECPLAWPVHEVASSYPEVASSYPEPAFPEVASSYPEVAPSYPAFLVDASSAEAYPAEAYPEEEALPVAVPSAMEMT